LVLLLEDGDEPEVEAAAAEGLARHAAIDDSRAVHALLRLIGWRGNRSHHVGRSTLDVDCARLAACHALCGMAADGRMRREDRADLIEVLVDAAADTNAELRRAAVSALVRATGTSDPSTRAVLMALLDDDDADMRWAAICWLGHDCERGDLEFVERLVELLEDPDDHVQRVSAGILARVAEHGDTGCLRALAQGLSLPTPAVRSACVEALHTLAPQQTDKEKVALWRLHCDLSGDDQKHAEEYREKGSRIPGRPMDVFGGVAIGTRRSGFFG